MAIADLGSHVTLTSAAATGYNDNITVPSGTVCAVIGVAYYKGFDGYGLNLASCSLAGETFVDINEQSANCVGGGMTHLAYVANASLGTGTQNLTIVWDSNPNEGPVVYVFFYSGVDTADVLEDAGGEQGQDSDATTGALTNDSGDWFVGMACGYSSTAIAWDNATEDDQDSYNNIMGAYAHLALSGANHTETMTQTGPGTWVAISGGILNAAAAGGLSIPIAMHTHKQLMRRRHR